MKKILQSLLFVTVASLFNTHHVKAQNSTHLHNIDILEAAKAINYEMKHNKVFAKKLEGYLLETLGAQETEKTLSLLSSDFCSCIGISLGIAAAVFVCFVVVGACTFGCMAVGHHTCCRNNQEAYEELSDEVNNV